MNSLPWGPLPFFLSALLDPIIPPPALTCGPPRQPHVLGACDCSMSMTGGPMAPDSSSSLESRTWQLIPHLPATSSARASHHIRSVSVVTWLVPVCPLELCAIYPQNSPLAPWCTTSRRRDPPWNHRLPIPIAPPSVPLLSARVRGRSTLPSARVGDLLGRLESFGAHWFLAGVGAPPRTGRRPWPVPSIVLQLRYVSPSCLNHCPCRESWPDWVRGALGRRSVCSGVGSAVCGGRRRRRDPVG
jgi:hypothetical protein